MAVAMRAFLALVLVASGWGADFSSAVSSYVDMATNSAHRVHPFTYMCWGRVPASAAYEALISRSSASTNRAALLKLDSVAGYLDGQSSESGVAAVTYAIGSTGYDDGAWHHFAFTSGSGSASVWADGATDATDATAANPPDDPVVGVEIGSLQAGAFGWSGDIDDCRIYNRALSADEIKTIYLSRGTDRITYGLVGRWPMLEGAPGVAMSGTDTVIDYSGTGEHGTPQGTTKPDYSESWLQGVR